MCKIGKMKFNFLKKYLYSLSFYFVLLRICYHTRYYKKILHKNEHVTDIKDYKNTSKYIFIYIYIYIYIYDIYIYSLSL